jgi:hypothetical protein
MEGLTGDLGNPPSLKTSAGRSGIRLMSSGSEPRSDSQLNAGEIQDFVTDAGRTGGPTASLPGEKLNAVGGI